MKRIQIRFIAGQTVTRTYSNVHFMNNITFKAKVVTVVPFEVKLFKATERAIHGSKVQAN